MRKRAFCIFLWPLYSDLISLLTITVRGVSNKHCLLPFFHYNTVWIANTEIGLDPNNSVIKRLCCSLKWCALFVQGALGT